MSEKAYEVVETVGYIMYLAGWVWCVVCMILD